MVRGVREVLRAQPTIEGAGVHLYRAFGAAHAPRFDPFLLLDDFRSAHPEEYLPGFPRHPHRGIETVTYITRGQVEHSDSLGHRGVIRAGDVQWMTSGSGIIHQEMPSGDENGRLGGIQLWLNLPSARKMTPPRYQDAQATGIPEVELDSGAWIRVICGEFRGAHGPVEDLMTDPGFLDVHLPPGDVFEHFVERSFTALIYVMDGDVRAEPDTSRFIGERHVVVLSDGDSVEIEAGRRGTHFLLLYGRPLGEPVAWRGPIVMTTDDELWIAFAELQNGTFLDHAQRDETRQR